ncbi:MAG TPA: CoA pyrophosphatase, partial [Parvibaculum sp.]
AEVFEVPLSFLMNPKNHERHKAMWRGEEREYYAMPYNGHYIWGATAGMLKNMYDRIFAE